MRVAVLACLVWLGAGAVGAAEYAVTEWRIPGPVVSIEPGVDGAVLVRTAADIFIVGGDPVRSILDPALTGVVVLPVSVDAARMVPHSRIAQGDDGVARAWLADPTDRYAHGVLGDRLEAATLMLRLDDAGDRHLSAGSAAVFEDLTPRLADLDGDGRDEVIVVKSYLDRGAALTVVGLDPAGQAVILAETPPIGRPFRWLNPIGAADFDGDGAIEIAYVETPHIGGTLMLREWRDGALLREHAEPGFSNHAIGSTELGLAAIADLDGDGVPDLAVPNSRRDGLRLVSFAGGVFRELADLPLDGRVATAIVPLGDAALVFALEDGRPLVLRYR